MQYDLKLQLAAFGVLVALASGLFGFCISEGVSTVFQYIYLFSAVFTDTVAYFVLEGTYEKHWANNGHSNDIQKPRPKDQTSVG